MLTQKKRRKSIKVYDIVSKTDVAVYAALSNDPTKFFFDFLSNFSYTAKKKSADNSLAKFLFCFAFLYAYLSIFYFYFGFNPIVKLLLTNIFHIYLFTFYFFFFAVIVLYFQNFLIIFWLFFFLFFFFFASRLNIKSEKWELRKRGCKFVETFTVK